MAQMEKENRKLRYSQR